MVTIRDSVTATGCNISDGGLYVSTDEPFTVGQRVPITMPLPGGDIKVQGVVKHAQNGKGVGLEFSGLSEEQSAGISGFIDRVAGGEKVDIPGAAPKPACDGPPVTEKATPARGRAPKDKVILFNNSVFSQSDLQMFISALEDAGLEVLELTAQSAALEALSDESVRSRAVIVAAESIHDDGFPLLGAIKKNPTHSNVPLLVLSTSFDKKFINRVMAYGASFAHKMSLTPEQLVAFLSQY
jgi:hypothetical protein